MVSERGRKMFASLKQVDFDRTGRDPHHNLTDPLEIVALAEGLKPAFLGGQSARSNKGVLKDLAAVSEKHGMFARWSRGLLPLTEILPRSTPLDRDYIEYQLADIQKTDAAIRPVLWIFNGSATEALIDECEHGKRPSAEALGYPCCCVDHFVRLARKYAIKVDRVRALHNPATIADLVALEQKGVVPSAADVAQLEAVDNQISLGNWVSPLSSSPTFTSRRVQPAGRRSVLRQRK
jgi:hypothetical protein